MELLALIMQNAFILKNPQAFDMQISKHTAQIKATRTLRGRKKTGMTTDALMKLLRGNR